MNCSHCNQKLYRIHPFNTQYDLDICINPECPVKRRPQGCIPNPRNAKMFGPQKGAQSEALLTNFKLDRIRGRGRYAEV